MSEARHQCWSCSEMIPYTRGFCDTCVSLIPLQVLPILDQAQVNSELDEIAPTLAGMIRAAVADYVKFLRRPKPPPTTKIAVPPTATGADILEMLGLSGAGKD